MVRLRLLEEDQVHAGDADAVATPQPRPLGEALAVEERAVAAPFVGEAVPSSDRFHLGMEAADPRVVGKESGDVTLVMATQDAAQAHGVDPFALVHPLGPDQHGHDEATPPTECRARYGS